MKRIMLSLELLSQCENPVVASATILDMDDSSKNHISRFRIGEQVDLGRKISDRELVEIHERGPDRFKELFSAGPSLRYGLINLGRHLEKAEEIWSGNPLVELTALRSLYRLDHLKCPWHPEAERCVRTAAKLAHIDLELSPVEQSPSDPYDPFYPCLAKTAIVDEVYRRLRVER